MNQNQIVLLTGVSTGIGRSTALHLDQLGYTVFAGVRREQDGIELQKQASDRLRPIILDITKPDDIANALAVVGKACGSTGLTALVNNAGYNYNAAFEFTDEAKARQMMEVNFFGLYKMSQTFIPLLRQFAKGSGKRAKLVNIGSIGSILGFPWESFYHASKFAVLGLTESLRYELRSQGISVVAVLPGGIKTEFMPKTSDGIDAAIAAMTPEGKQLYGSGLTKMRSMISQAVRFGSEPEKVARRIARVIGATNPNMQYFVGADARFFFWFGTGFANLVAAWVIARAVWGVKSVGRQMITSVEIALHTSPSVGAEWVARLVAHAVGLEPFGEVQPVLKGIEFTGKMSSLICS